MDRTIISLVFFLLLLAGCQRGGEKTYEQNNTPDKEYVTVKGRMFVDTAGRQVILHGINVINKNPETGYVCALDEEIYRKLHLWGFNIVRLGIIWDGLEPEPGKYNEEMFKCLDRNIAWAKKYGIYVLLDMHQDLYSVKYSDGAPLWATLDEGKPNYKGEIWSDAYLISPAIQTAFDNFWKNAKAPDGTGIQDHYAALWKTIARRYADNPVVIGYDIMNEPFPGSGAEKYVQAMVLAYGQWLAETTGKNPGGEKELLALWNSPEGKMKVMETLKDTNVYKRVLFATLPLSKIFEEGPLHRMYSRVGRAIREVDTNHILFLEHNYFCNPGVPSRIKIPITGKDGTPDRKVAYAPHGYDLLLDTKAYLLADNNRVDFLMNVVDQTSHRLNIPMLVGEWGAFHSMDSAFYRHGKFIVDKFMKMKNGETFWCYFDGIEKYTFFNILDRPYPLAVNGTLKEYSYIPGEKVFSSSWVSSGTIKQPSLFYIPRVTPGDAIDINIVPEGKGFQISFTGSQQGAVISVAPARQEGERKITIRY